MAVQWLGLGTFIAMDWVQSLFQELRSHRLHGMAKYTHTHTLNIVYSDSKKIYLGISVTRHVLEFHAKSYKMLIRESKGDINN